MGYDKFWKKKEAVEEGVASVEEGVASAAEEGAASAEEGSNAVVEFVWEEEGPLGLDLKPAASGRGAKVVAVNEDALKDAKETLKKGMVLRCVGEDAVHEMEFKSVIDAIRTSSRP